MNAKETVKEVILAILPITIIIAILNFALIHIPTETFLNFLGGSVMVVLGFTLFLLGVKTGFLPMGESIGAKVVEKGKSSLIIGTAFVLGFVITFAEPDVQVLIIQANEVTGGSLNGTFIISSISLGVGIFLALAIARIFLKTRLLYLLLGGYLVIFILAVFASPDYISLAFDSGGVTTGPMTVPFILSLGIGVAAVASDRKHSGNSFGLVGLASIGPVMAVLILGVIMQ